MNLAVRYEWIERNPAARATMPSVRKRKPNASGPQLAARLLSHVWEQGDGLRRTAAGTGTLHRCGSWYSGFLMAAGGIFGLRDRAAIAGQVLIAVGDAGICLTEPARCIRWPEVGGLVVFRSWQDGDDAGSGTWLSQMAVVPGGEDFQPGAGGRRLSGPARRGVTVALHDEKVRLGELSDAVHGYAPGLPVWDAGKIRSNNVRVGGPLADAIQWPRSGRCWRYLFARPPAAAVVSADDLRLRHGLVRANRLTSVSEIRTRAGEPGRYAALAGSAHLPGRSLTGVLPAVFEREGARRVDDLHHVRERRQARH